MKGGQARLWYQFKNWFRTKPGPGEPLRFLCGSEEELRRVTMWICHFHADIFQFVNEANVIYFSNDLANGCAGLGLPPSVCHTEVVINIRSKTYRLFTLVYKHNKLAGTTWIVDYWDGTEKKPVSPDCRPGLPFWFGIIEQSVYLRVKVQPPSAHERAKALLSLSEWLDGKVSEQEKRELLQLPN